MSTAIKFENISKQYRLGLVSTKTLSHDLNRWWQTSILRKEDPYLRIGETNDRASKGNSEYVWALKDIDFEVKQGEVLGIIGKNGAGKSTLLKLLSRVTGPTTGSIKAKGRIASLLEVGTGFHPELTGRENIYMNGSIMGMTKAEITRKLDEIVEFAGVARYIDTPTKRYSSGMTVRLGFSIAAHLEPEILVVDEVLAVGDAEFQKKAIGKMQDVAHGEGRTVLFVSHNMNSIKQLCNKGVLLGNGSLVYSGEINDVVENYLHVDESEIVLDLRNRTDREGKQLAKVVDVKIKAGVSNSYTNQILTGEPMSIFVEIESKQDFDEADVLLSIYKVDGLFILHTNTQFASIDKIKLKKGSNLFKCAFDSFPIQIGQYFVRVAVDANNTLQDRLDHTLFFNVVENNIYNTGKLPGAHQGIALLPNNWDVI